MRKLMLTLIQFGFFCTSTLAGQKSANQGIRVFPGYVTKVTCEGKLLVSSIGNDSLIRLEALPPSLGCAVLLKPQTNSGRTNLVLETSAGSIQVTVDLRPGSPTAPELKISLSGERI